MFLLYLINIFLNLHYHPQMKYLSSSINSCSITFNIGDRVGDVVDRVADVVDRAGDVVDRVGDVVDCC